MKEKFLTYLKKYIVGAATAIFLAVMSFAYYLFPASTEVPVWVLFLFALISFSICMSFYAYLRSKYECIESDHSVKVRTLLQKDNNLIAIADKSALLKQNTIVQLCLKEYGDEYEVVIGWGYVQTINSKGFPQIVMSKSFSGFSLDLEELQEKRSSLMFCVSISREIWQAERGFL